jgi:chaperonin GroEL
MSNYNFHLPSEIVKDLYYGKDARDKIMAGVRKLSDAVESTLGASGRTVIFEDIQGQNVVTKDGVSVAKSVILEDPVENMGANLIKQAADNTVRIAGDGTSSSCLIARYLLEFVNQAMDDNDSITIRDIKNGIEAGLEKIYKALDDMAIEVTGEKLKSVATISCNNDAELGSIIGEAFQKVGDDGVVLIEDSETDRTYSDVVDGVQFESGLKSRYLVTDKDRGVAELENPYILICSSPIANVRKITGVVEFVINKGRPLLIIGQVEEQAMKALLVNKAKGIIKVNIVDPAGFGKYKGDSAEDLAILTGARVINEELGDDIDLIKPDDLGEAIKSVTDDKNTVITVDKEGRQEVSERIESVRKLIANEQNGFLKKKLEERLGMLSAKIGVVYVGANSEVELKEKRDRVDDAVHATKASLSGGIVSGGGVALRDASKVLDLNNVGEKALYDAINMPLKIILKNASLDNLEVEDRLGYGIDAVTGNTVNMIDANIVDPVLVTKTALKNAASVVKTIISADCVISNKRMEVAV